MRKLTNIRKFRLSDSFVEPYKTAEVPWGPLGYVTFKRTYARRLSEFDADAEGTEEWWQTCRRVIEGMFHIQKEHVVRLGLEWNDNKAQKTAKDAFDRLFNLKWTPPGRGLWMMGTKFVEERTGAALFNCAFRSTQDINRMGGYIFSWIMDALMVGVGVGFDTKGAGTITIKEPTYTNDTLVIDDSREGWVNSVHVLLDGFFFGSNVPKFDYSNIRPEGAPIYGFGGTSSGAAPLIELHENLTELFSSKVGELISSVDIVDTENLIGRCVVAGNVRRSAALAIGQYDDTYYLEMKNDQEKLYHHRWGSNNSFDAMVGMDYSWHAEQSQKNGEPGYIWLENARRYGRMKDGENYDDAEVMGFNPCVEQSLHNAEMCCLVETFPAKHDDYEDYVKTLKCAYLYGKTVTLVNTHWPETNAKMLKNRRIGLSQSGIVQAFNKHGRREMMDWCDHSYDYVKELDTEYSNWLCVPKSIKMTSIKPSGTVSLLNGSTPGIHFPESEYYIRRIRFSDTSPIVPQLQAAGYRSEKDKYSPNTTVVEFPIHEQFFTKGKKDVSMWEQLEIAAQYQNYWADNAVSVTVTFTEQEASQLKSALEMYETRLKAVSFLKYQDTGYEQAPYEPITKEQYNEMSAEITPIQRIETNVAGVGTKYCDGESCEI
ncbi:MAG: ribonucleoside-triphosphate reductase, adenosylcobalamin-dependent [Flavobacteriaceae bacterium]|nr:ribonucleoside-triphosphate reductase, adenosylcobalamin-dependent [Flavobacteriaceae bacterium]